MRRILTVSMVAAGIGLAGASGASAMPANGSVIGDAATAAGQVTPVQWGYGGHWRWGSRGEHWRWGSRGFGGPFAFGGGHWRWGSRGGHWRWGSRGFY